MSTNAIIALGNLCSNRDNLEKFQGSNILSTKYQAIEGAANPLPWPLVMDVLKEWALKYKGKQLLLCSIWLYLKKITLRWLNLGLCTQ
jgi:hypothetical protein